MNENDIKEDRHCFNCGKTFAKPAHLIRHKHRKTPCLIQEIPENDIAPNRCKYCNKAYQSKSTLTRHYKTCKIRNGGMEMLMRKVSKEEENEQKTMMKQMMAMMQTQQNMMKVQQEEILNMKKKMETMVIAPTTSNSHNNTNSHNQITINNYLTPNTEGLTLDKSTLDNYSNLSYAVLDNIYFNAEHPENHSFYVSNKKEKELMVYTNCDKKSEFNDLKMKWKMLTTDKDREMFVRDLQNTILKDGTKIVNGMYNNDTDTFAALPKDLRDRIIEFNGGERLKEKEVIQIALKGSKMKNFRF